MLRTKLSLFNASLWRRSAWLKPLQIVLLVLISGTFFQCNRCVKSCQNGVCIEKFCDCFEWYEGNRCDRLIVDQHTGQYGGVFYNYINDTEKEVELTLTLISDSIRTLEADSFELRFTTANRFAVKERLFEAQLVQGEGEVNGTRLTMRLDAVDSLQQQLGLFQLEKRE